MATAATRLTRSTAAAAVANATSQAEATIAPSRLDGSGPTFLLAVSYACGWIYTVAWSASFYPQVLLNSRRKSVAGLSLDFAYLNVLGFLCYSIFNITFFASPLVRQQYRARHDGKDNVVQLNDVAFAVHALVLTSVTATQTLLYARAPGQKTSRSVRILLAAFLIIILASLLVCIVSGGGASSNPDKRPPLEWIDFVQILSSIKLIITFIKYLPQMLLNYRRKSTLGWSINNIILDATGGIFSLIQLFIDSARTGDWSSAIGDFSKLGLGLISIGFDVIFIVQHYVLYGPMPVENEGGPEDAAEAGQRRLSDERTGLLDAAEGRQ